MRLGKILSATFLLGCSLALMTSCSSSESDLVSPPSQKEGLNTVTMKLVGGCQGFDQNSQAKAKEGTRASGTNDWPNGAHLYLQFKTDKGMVSGSATYDKAQNAWTVNYYGTIASGVASTCEAYYFEDAVASNSSTVQLNDRSAIYEDKDGSYLLDGNTLTVTASLKPKTGRIRFKGTKGLPIVVTGITHYTSYDVASNNFFTTTAVVKDTVSSSTGATPYLYGYFSDSEAPTIGLVSNSSEAYTMACSTSMYKTGESGYLDIPTDAEHNGWATGLNFTVKGVTFKMIPVDWGSKSFLIGETEVTEGLYYAITDGTTTTPNLPISSQTYGNFLSFLTKLGDITSINFRLPTKEEWQYAAKGGSKSLSFTYSGSNTPGDVAWYSGNSNDTRHEVKQKQPNELGIYDMSGNVCEWTSTKVSNYYANSFYVCGGCYASQESGINITSKYYSTDNDYKYSSIGIRLALTLK